MSDQRRETIIKLLTLGDEPITGTSLAKQFGVSRQVIVQDIAILRAQGENIIASANGYFMQQKYSSHKIIKNFISEHHSSDELFEELSIIVEYGGKVIDVMIEHPVYGEITGSVHVSTMDEVKAFCQRVKETDAKPLSSLTGGIHYHTIEVPSETIYSIIEEKLREKGFMKN